jgi:hypothetical protein
VLVVVFLTFDPKSGLYNLIANKALPPPPLSTPPTPSDSALNFTTREQQAGARVLVVDGGEELL